MELPFRTLHKCLLQSRQTFQTDLIRRLLIPKNVLPRNNSCSIPPCTSSVFHRSCHSANRSPNQTCSRTILCRSVRHQSTISTKGNTVAKAAGASSSLPSSQKTSKDPPTDTSPTPEGASEEASARFPAYELSATCQRCEHRSVHRISQQGYHHGTVLITCPGCKNRHVISDHLKIFSDKRVTLEDILRDKGQTMQKGRRDAAGEIEFWDDGTDTHKVPGKPEGRSDPRRY